MTENNKETCGIACRFIIFLLGFIGIVFSIGTIFSCEFYKYENIAGGWFPGQSGEGTVGLWRAELADGECNAYPDEADFDGWMVGARATSLVAGILGIIALCLLVFECVFCKVCGSKLCLNLMLGFAFVCQSFTFLLYGTEDFCGTAGTECSLGNGAIFSIVALVMYLISSCAVCCAPKPEPLIKGCCNKEKQEDKVVADEEQVVEQEPEKQEPEPEPEPEREEPIQPEEEPKREETPDDPVEEGVEVDNLFQSF